MKKTVHSIFYDKMYLSFVCLLINYHTKKTTLKNDIKCLTEAMMYECLIKVHTPSDWVWAEQGIFDQERYSSSPDSDI